MGLLLFLSNVSLAQIILQGTVVDSKSFEPMAFVNISLKGRNQGTTTNIDGKYFFRIPSAKEEDQIEFSFIGYEKISYSIAELRGLSKIKLNPLSIELQEVVVYAGENPSHQIVRKAIASRHLHDPKLLSSYSFNCYNKTIYTLDGLDNSSISSDSIIEKNLKYGHFLVLENYTELKHLRPNFNKETILKNKVSGLKDPKIAILSSNLQPFAFYDQQIDLFGSVYINPLSDGSLSRYEFYLSDTLLSEKDTTYVLTFEPIKRIEYKTLKGILYINSDRYAIENVIAYPADTTMKIDFRIQQKYERVDGQWFPKELYTRYLSKENGIAIKADTISNKEDNSAKAAKNKKIIPMVLKNQSYFSNIAINPPIEKRDFDLSNVSYQTEKLNQVDWQALRPDTLTQREIQTYYNYDTLNEKTKRIINKTVDVSMQLAGGRLPFGKVSLLPSYLIRINRYEKLALGIGLTTNERFSNRVQFQGFGMYGFGDQALKFGANAQLNLNKSKSFNLTLRYLQDIAEPGYTNYLKFNGPDLTSGADVIRRFLATRMDSIQRYTIELNFKPMRFVQASVFYENEKRDPTYRYSFNQSEIADPTFMVSQLGLNFRFAFKETITDLGGLQMITGSSFPFITARISRAFKGLLDGENEFTKADLRIKHVLNSLTFGKTTFYGNFVKVWGSDIPYSYLNFSNAIRFEGTNNVSVYAPGYFQTMSLYEFTSDTYGQVAIEQNFGPLFTALKGRCRPELVLIQNVAYGSLRNRLAHELVEIKTLEKGYYESGLILNNILRVDAKLYWLGYGAGVFYRYGENALPNQKDNLSFVISTSIKL